MQHIHLEQVALTDLHQRQIFLQSGLWGAFKERFGWKSLAFIVRIDDLVNGLRNEYPLLVLLREVCKRIFSCVYTVSDVKKYQPV